MLTDVPVLAGKLERSPERVTVSSVHANAIPCCIDDSVSGHASVFVQATLDAVVSAAVPGDAISTTSSGTPRT